jgi:hypothetical protein
MRGVPAWVLKTGAVWLSLLATVAAAGYVGAHVQNASAPLRPSLRGLHTTSDQAVTETHVS